MELREFVGTVVGFYQKSAVEQLLIIGWFLEARQEKPSFSSDSLRQCFRTIAVEAPDMSVYLPRLLSKKPPQLVKEKAGYRLSGSLRREFDHKYGGDPTTVAISAMLTGLPAKVPDVSERAYLAEALNCYRVKAYRAAIIMAWNLAYDHLVRWVVTDPQRLADCNAALVDRFPKKGLTIQKLEDCADLRESEFIELCRTSKILNKNTVQVLKEKLARRNSVAHPSSIVVSQHQADDAISDLVNNVIIPLSAKGP